MDTQPATTVRKRILIIEDDREVRELLEALLDPLYSVVLQPRCDDAPRMVHKHSPQLIVLDIHLPGLNGFQICRELKSRPAMRHIPILFLTGRHDNWTLAQSRQAGADDLIQKPFEPAELRQKIERLIGI